MHAPDDHGLTGELPGVLGTQPSASFTLGKLELQEITAYWDGVPVELNRNEYRVIRLLTTHEGINRSHRQLYEIIYPEAGSDPNKYLGCIRTTVRRVWRRFKAIDPCFDELKSVPCVGYRWGESSIDKIEALGRQVRLTVGLLTIYPDLVQVFWDRTPVELTRSECCALALLARNPGRDYPYREIHEAIHGEGFISGSGPDGFKTNVRAVIKRARDKFRSVDPTFNQIKCYHSFGYQLKNPVA